MADENKKSSKKVGFGYILLSVGIVIMILTIAYFILFDKKVNGAYSVRNKPLTSNNRIPLINKNINNLMRKYN